MANRSLQRVSKWLALLLLAIVATNALSTLSSADTPAETWDAAASWAFNPAADSFNDSAVLDLRYLNEKQSGETGFVKLSQDGNSFVGGDQQPLRFWSVGSDLYREKPEEMDRHCRFLAKLGVNLVRLHATIANTKEGAAMSDVNEQEIEGIFRFIKAAKANGIYVLISPYYGHHETPKSWKLTGYSDAGGQPWGAIFIDSAMQAAYKQWTRALYARVNPHTGFAIKDDPTVAVLQIHNEDSLFFWTVMKLPEPLVDMLRQRFADWLIEKHGSLDQALAAWGGLKHANDDFEHNRVGIYRVYHMTRDWDKNTNRRLRDETQFTAELQRKFYADMGHYLRDELGCKQLLNATNWRTADDSRLKAIERWTYAALDIDAENEYYGSDYQHQGENDGYRIDPDHFMVNESVLHKPLELTTNFKSQAGHPFMVTETSWKNPNLYQSEGPFLISAYQAISGVDAVVWFSADAVTWNLDPRFPFWNVRGMNPQKKWTCSTPMLMGMFPAAALSFRRGDLKPGEMVVRETRSVDSLWDRQPAAVDDNEIYGINRETNELKTTVRENGSVSRAAFLVGRVETQVIDKQSAAPEVHDLAKYLKADQQRLLSNTGEVDWNYGVGVCTVNSPRTKGVTGFLKAGGEKYALSDVTISSTNEYASVTVVSLDDQPLSQAKKILVQVGTMARLTDWATEPTQFDFNKQKIDGLRITNTGKPPWRIADTKISVAVKNRLLSRAMLLDTSGYRSRDVEFTRQDDTVTIVLPRDTMYLVVE